MSNFSICDIKLVSNINSICVKHNISDIESINSDIENLSKDIVDKFLKQEIDSRFSNNSIKPSYVISILRSDILTNSLIDFLTKLVKVYAIDIFCIKNSSSLSKARTLIYNKYLSELSSKNINTNREFLRKRNSSTKVLIESIATKLELAIKTLDTEEFNTPLVLWLKNDKDSKNKLAEYKKSLDEEISNSLKEQLKRNEETATKLSKDKTFENNKTAFKMFIQNIYLLNMQLNIVKWLNQSFKKYKVDLSCDVRAQYLVRTLGINKKDLESFASDDIIEKYSAYVNSLLKFFGVVNK